VTSITDSDIAAGRQRPARIILASSLYLPQSLSYGESYAKIGTLCTGIILVRGGDKRLCTFSGPCVASQTSGTHCIILKSSCDGFYPLVRGPSWPPAPSGAQFH